VMNPYAMLAAVGVPLAFGSDSPVTPLDPWRAVRAAAGHTAAASALPLPAALAAHTVGGHHAARTGDPLAGRLVPGAPASYAVWDDVAAPRPRCVRTVRRGRVVHPLTEG